MKIEFRQTKPGHCSVFTLANIFREKKFLIFLDDQRFKGCTVKQEDFMLEFCNTGLKTSIVASCCQLYGHLPKRWVYENILKSKFDFEKHEATSHIKCLLVPYLLSVHRVKNMLHSVSVLAFENALYYIDPYKSEYIKIDSFETFDSLFIDCVEVRRFELDDGSRNYAVLVGENIGYEELITESAALEFPQSATNGCPFDEPLNSKE